MIESNKVAPDCAECHYPSFGRSCGALQRKDG